jgi:membrane carboxypeptidase/penicillin-binding protein
MQVARNFYLSTEKTYTRKIYEMLLAFKMESLLTKDQILEVYMNQIFLGQRAYGFASASEIYFGKPLKDISIAEAAMLAGLPQAPSAYNPISNPDRAKSGQLRILDRMFDNGYITADQRNAARDETLRYRAPNEVAVHAEYVAEAARQLIFTQYGDDAYTRGLNVYLTLKSDDQMVAYRALRKGIMDYERRQVYRGPEDYVDLPADPKEVDARIAEYQSLPQKPMEFMPVTIQVGITESRSEKASLVLLADVINTHSGDMATAGGNLSASLLSRSIDPVKAAAVTVPDPGAQLDSARAAYFDTLVEYKAAAATQDSAQASEKLADARLRYNQALRAAGLEAIQ